MNNKHITFILCLILLTLSVFNFTNISYATTSFQIGEETIVQPTVNPEYMNKQEYPDNYVQIDISYILGHIIFPCVVFASIARIIIFKIKFENEQKQKRKTEDEILGLNNKK